MRKVYEVFTTFIAEPLVVVEAAIVVDMLREHAPNIIRMAFESAAGSDVSPTIINIHKIAAAMQESLIAPHDVTGKLSTKVVAGNSTFFMKADRK